LFIADINLLLQIQMYCDKLITDTILQRIITYFSLKFIKYMRCGDEVPGMILLQACLYTYSSLRVVTFEVLPLNSYAPSPTMLPLLEIFLELL